MNFKILPFLFFIFIFRLNAQVGINTTTPNGQLDISSSEYGVLIPRVTLTAINLASPILNPETQNNSLSNSTLVYNMNTTNGSNGVSPGFYYWETNQWVRINSGDRENIYTTDGAFLENRFIDQGTFPLQLDGIAGKSALTLRRTDNSETTGIAFRNSGNAYDATIFMEAPQSTGLIFATGGNSNTIDDLTPTLILNNDSSITFSDYGGSNHNSNNPTKLLGVDTNGNVVQSDVREDWSITGNSGINENNNFLGTTNSRDLRIRTNNTLRATFQSNGQVSINANNNPDSDDLFFVQASGVFEDAITAYSTNGISVHGYDEDNGIGVLGRSTNEIGVNGRHIGNNNIGYGVYGETSSFTGYGVYGVEPNASSGNSNFGFALYAQGDLGWSGGTYNVSDRKLKHSVKELDNALSIIKQLQAKEYYYDTEKFENLNLSHKKQYGFIAQEVKEILPEITAIKHLPNYDEYKEDEQDDTIEEVLMMDYTKIIPILTKAMQEQQETIESQEERIAKLEQQVQQLLNK